MAGEHAGPATVPNLGSPIKKVVDTSFGFSFDESGATTTAAACELISMSKCIPDDTLENANNETASTIKDSSEEETLEKTRLIFEEDDVEHGAEESRNCVGGISTCCSSNCLSRQLSSLPCLS